MEIDKKTIRALSSETRIKIMKSLGKRRKMPSELSRELKLATSTITKHIDKLEEARLVKKSPRGKKFIYYDLSERGRAMIKPKFPVQFVLMLGLGILLMVVSIPNLFISKSLNLMASAGAPRAEMAETIGTAQTVAPATDPVYIVVLIVSLILIVVGIYKVIKWKLR